MAFAPRKIDVSKEQLYQWYVVEKRSYREIAKLLGIRSSKGKDLLIAHQIHVRSASETQAQISCDRDTLYNWYVIEKRSYRWIMSKLGCNSARSLKRLLLENGIEIRYGGEAVKTQWLDNDERRKKAGETANKSWAPFRGLITKRPEVAAKISASKMGDKNPMWGKTGNQNANFLGGKKTWQKGRKIRPEKRKEIIKTLGGVCKKCGTDKDLTLNHNPPWRICRSHDLKFLEVLCKKCHFQGPIHLR